ncbi:hypothetical protein KKH36_02225 [Patescibacteria group bacterium]|nr:hypothetical protein [Patescibacteria group bacterium]
MNNIKIFMKKIILFTALGLILLFTFYFNQQDKVFEQPHVMAGNEHNLSGYAWSDNIGWISFNCLDLDTCGVVNYGVNVNSDNELSGYAWSDNIGWISFKESDLSDCPKGTCKAKLVGNELTGWARVLKNGNGWDGWISLGTQPTETINYGAFLSENKFEGYAWGSDVVGWIDFSPIGYDGVLFNAFKFPVIVQFNIQSVVSGARPNINWTTENASSCEGSWKPGSLCSNQAACASGSDVANVVLSEMTYTLTCYGNGGSVFETKTIPAYYTLNFINGYPNNVDFGFVVRGATTTKTKIGVTPWNGFNESVTLNALLNEATPEALPIGSYPIYSDKILSPSEYDIGSEFSIFIKKAIVGPHIVPIEGSGSIFGNLDITINAHGIAPKYQEI